MPTTENDRRNLQQPTLDNPSMPDHDRRKDEGMHSVVPDEVRDQEMNAEAVLGEDIDLAAPDQEFGQILESGTKANGGRIPVDPNNWLTSDAEVGSQDLDPENRGESLVDDLNNDKH